MISVMIRIVKAYITFHMKRNPKWDPKEVSSQTPHDIRVFITHKCGAKEDNCEGRKVSAFLAVAGMGNAADKILHPQFSTAISTRAALTFWYRNVRPNESAAEWRHDPNTGIW
jgi:hypothetical protein